MTTSAIVLLVFSGILIWGGLGASLAFLMRKPEVASYPEGYDADDFSIPQA